MKKLHFTLIFLFWVSGLIAETIYVSPSGTGNGMSESAPLGSFITAINKLDPGDELVLLDGEYHHTLSMNSVDGTVSQPITIRAKNTCKAHINGQAQLTNAIALSQCDNLIIDGILAGRTVHAVWSINNCKNVKLTRCAGYDAGYLEAQDGIVKDTFADNCHIFGIAYSDRILAEDVWAWGTGRYDFMYYQCTRSTVRRGVFRPTNTELGYGYDRCPHSGFNLYDCDNCLAENCIAFETRVHPNSDHDENNPWGLVQGGMVFDDHTDPSGYNKVLGCFDLDNGQWRTDVARSNPAVHLMSKWSGMLEDVVIWKNALDYGIVKGSNARIDLPERALIGSPTKIKQNTIVDYNLNHRYVDGELTDTPLWPWPYEDIIQELFGMQETITEYVVRMVEPHVDIQISAQTENPVSVPTTAKLGTNYPNPFNSNTTIPFSLTETDRITIHIYNAMGQKIKTLENGVKPAGEYSILWDGTNESDVQVVSGVYFIYMTTSQTTFSRKVLLVQ